MGKPGKSFVYLPAFGLASALTGTGFEQAISGIFLFTQDVGVGCVCREGEDRGHEEETIPHSF